MKNLPFWSIRVVITEPQLHKTQPVIQFYWRNCSTADWERLENRSATLPMYIQFSLKASISMTLHDLNFQEQYPAKKSKSQGVDRLAYGS